MPHGMSDTIKYSDQSPSTQAQKLIYMTYKLVNKQASVLNSYYYRVIPPQRFSIFYFVNTSPNHAHHRS